MQGWSNRQNTLKLQKHEILMLTTLYCHLQTKWPFGFSLLNTKHSIKCNPQCIVTQYDWVVSLVNLIMTDHVRTRKWALSGVWWRRAAWHPDSGCWRGGRRDGGIRLVHRNLLAAVNSTCLYAERNCRWSPCDLSWNVRRCEWDRTAEWMTVWVPLCPPVLCESHWSSALHAPHAN